MGRPREGCLCDRSHQDVADADPLVLMSTPSDGPMPVNKDQVLAFAPRPSSRVPPRLPSIQAAGEACRAALGGAAQNADDSTPRSEWRHRFDGWVASVAELKDDTGGRSDLCLGNCEVEVGS
jgi:hypothetical protein